MLELKIYAQGEGARTGIGSVVEAHAIFAGKKFGIKSFVFGDGEDILDLSEDACSFASPGFENPGGEIVGQLDILHLEVGAILDILAG